MILQFFYKLLQACLIALSFFLPLPAIANEGGNEKNKPLPIGNFSIPTVTQVAPLVSFGQLLIGKNALLPQLCGSYFRSRSGYSSIITPNVIYGIRDDLSIFFNVPFTPRSRCGSSYSSGVEDIFLQLEYGYYSKSRKDCTLQGTIVANVQFPTGSSSKNPRTGNNSFSYFLGTTFAYLSYDWYAFVSPGVNLTTMQHHKKYGNSYLYQCGFARYIQQLSPPGWVFDLMFEFDGIYVEKDKIHGTDDPDTGGNSIFVTPSIYFASKRWIVQWGAGFPLVQDLNGKQDKIQYLLASTLAISFQF